MDTGDTGPGHGAVAEGDLVDDGAGAGADCALLAGAAWPGVGGCLADGRVEAISGSAERLGCWQVPGVDGVLCCQD